jgi:hypothetical protein
MRVLFILAALCFSANAFAQNAAPKAGSKQSAKSKEPTGCRLVGTVKGTKLWAGECMGPELRGTASDTGAPTLTDRASAAIPPGQK